MEESHKYNIPLKKIFDQMSLSWTLVDSQAHNFVKFIFKYFEATA